MRIVLLLLLFIYVNPAAAQWKRVEKSAKKKPSWVGGFQVDYWIVSAQGATLETAKNMALQQIKQQMAEALVTYVQSSSQQSVQEQLSAAGRVFSEQYVAQSTTSTGGFQAVSGIAANRPIDFYWEQYKQRKGDSVYFHYHLRYPMSQAELASYLADWRAKDEANSSKLASLAANVFAVNSLEEIAAALAELKALEPLFFDERKQKVNAVRAAYRSVLNHIRSEIVASDSGRYIHQLWYGNKQLAYHQPLEFVSNCARFNWLGEQHGQQVFETSSHFCETEEERLVKYRVNLPERLPLQASFVLQPAKNSLSIISWYLQQTANPQLVVELNAQYHALTLLTGITLYLEDENLFFPLETTINKAGRQQIRLPLTTNQMELLKSLNGKRLQAQLDFIHQIDQQQSQIRWIKVLALNLE
jgi:hypothetical protein